MTKRMIKNYLFSPEGLEALRAFVDPSTLFAFDLDGTLAPIARDPGGIQVPAAVRQALAELKERAIIAIITGRSRLDALLHLALVPHYLVGNHGAEGLPGRKRIEESYTRSVRQWAEQLRSLLPAPAPGIVVEDKGMSLAIHYRSATDRRTARSLIGRAVQRLTPAPRAVGGKYVLNLLSPEAPDKGTAVRHLMALTGCVNGFFIGDDRTDEDVFHLGEDRLFTVRVGVEKRSGARFVLRGQKEVPPLLAQINAIVKQKALMENG
ncbi:MAG: trehalose-phosphatase [Syntrophaceae bacterium]|nr:trehalose-phosphatase [Syntrophaceae bacterium]